MVLSFWREGGVVGGCKFLEGASVWVWSMFKVCIQLVDLAAFFSEWSDFYDSFLSWSLLKKWISSKPQVTAVILYDPSEDKETHVHRIGRTGRAGHKGKAITFITDYDKYKVRMIVETMKRCGQDVPDDLMVIAKENMWAKKW